MALKEHTVEMLSISNARATGTFSYDEDVDDGPSMQLMLVWPDGEAVGVGTDYFEALCRIREQLEELGWRPICYGSSQNVFPSGMSRDMGRGLQAYRLELGHQALSANLVGIFDSGPDVVPVSVADQSQFFEKWLQSLRR